MINNDVNITIKLNTKQLKAGLKITQTAFIQTPEMSYHRPLDEPLRPLR